MPAAVDMAAGSRRGFGLFEKAANRPAMEDKIESFWGAVQLMAFVFVLAAGVSFAVAWVIKLTFSGVKMQKGRAEARVAKASAKAGKDASKRVD